MTAKEVEKSAKEIAEDEFFGPVEREPELGVQIVNSRVMDAEYQALLDMGAIDISEVDEVTVIDKQELINVSMVLLDWQFSKGDFKEPFVSVRVRTDQGIHVFTDGSSGIKQQLLRYEDKLRSKGMLDKVAEVGIAIPRGLRVSEYTYVDESTGETRPAKTYYFDNRPRR